MTWRDGSTSGDPRRFGTEAFYASLGRAFVAMCAVVPVLFLIEALDVGLHGNLDVTAGIIPHRIQGLDGVFFSPFLHADFNHLYSNSIPLILLGTFVLAAGTRRFLWSTLLIILISGLGVWFTGSPNSVVVGASGVIFGYLGVLLTRGVVERSWWNFAVVLLVGLLYGWQLLGILPTDEHISWQGHLFGLLGGVVAAILFRRRRGEALAAERGESPTLTLP
ncbi:rhomboid family intramembrane serine protease [Micromonospora sp. DR5-3]|uniref:rhomboid family intramembrane serine protease n=1 Tax=unclassified Micromonospora TaxID=2617518 RepID=UPI0011DC4D0A|nr:MULTISPECIES: rhomboid family intramembrane serine protease [unclassified Micromonospora]MCW3815364.1 rhomboid family intramembrane serine protease [Micromonospora sp. DR5-3]TYC22819.1 rhomboid family intramembrane serine protease [Micromonospora sp. MP36]